jgi:hypothetical protein
MKSPEDEIPRNIIKTSLPIPSDIVIKVKLNPVLPPRYHLIFPEKTIFFFGLAMVIERLHNSVDFCYINRFQLKTAPSFPYFQIMLRV